VGRDAFPGAKAAHQPEIFSCREMRVEVRLLRHVPEPALVAIGFDSTLTLSRYMEPSLASTRPTIILIVDVLPEPFGPK
jgi:hypothetical protein